MPDSASTATTTAFLLQVRHVSKSFPGVQALGDVSLDIEAGKGVRDA